MQDSEAARRRLIELEQRMRALSPIEDEYWRLKPERTQLRAAIDVLWLDGQRFGTRCERWAPLPWPDDVRARWRVLRELIEAYRGVPLGDIVDASYAGELEGRLVAMGGIGSGELGVSVKQWFAVLDELIATKRWFEVLRDSVGVRPVPNARAYLSIMVQGENDYHWAVRGADLLDEDPPVFGFSLDYEANRFVPDRTPPSYGPYGSYRSVSDFARAMLDGNLHGPLNAPLGRLSAVKPEYHYSMSDVRDYGVGLPGVWATPLVPRIDIGDDVRGDIDDDELDEIARRSEPPTRDDLRDTLAAMLAPDPLPADDARFGDVGIEDDLVEDMMSELEFDYELPFALDFKPATLRELLDEAERLARTD